MHMLILSQYLTDLIPQKGRFQRKEYFFHQLCVHSYPGLFFPQNFLNLTNRLWDSEKIHFIQDLELLSVKSTNGHAPAS